MTQPLVKFVDQATEDIDPAEHVARRLRSAARTLRLEFEDPDLIEIRLR
jgi:hypothetical protein